MLWVDVHVIKVFFYIGLFVDLLLFCFLLLLFFVALQYMVRELEPSSKINLLYLDNTDSGIFIFQFNDSANDLMELMDAIDKFVSSEVCSPLSMDAIAVGQPVLAQYSADDLWYRGSVVALPGKEMVEVLFVDYNNSESIPIKSVRQMVPEFMTLCKQAISCQLQDASGIMTCWSSEMIENFGELSKETEFLTASLVECHGHPLVISFVKDCPKWNDYFKN